MNELEMFEAYMKKEHPFIDTVNGAYEAMWNLWQARVPEGYVVVTKEPTCEMIDVGMGSFCFPLDNGRFSNHDLIFAYRAMLEAVEK